ncbi:MAG: hypothetical protein K2J32_07530 [Ruminococcus sp.]|nr:hypothetical protein [Ruminococcus sp.]
MTEYYDIVFSGISSANINRFIKEILNIKQESIISSHFFSEISGDYEFSDDMNLNEYFSGSNTASIFSETITLNCTYNKAVCVISSDAESVDVDCSISENDFDISDIAELTEWLENLCSEKIISYAEISSSAENTPLFKTK